MLRGSSMPINTVEYPDLVAIYPAILGRPIDPSGLQSYQALLDSGVSFAAVETSIAESVESETDIGRIYAADLGRWVDQASLVSWVGYLANGGTQAAVQISVAYSPEASAAINASYQASLGRAATSADIAGWQQNFANGSSLTVLHGELASSAEASQAVNSVYVNDLDRAASPAELSTQLQVLSAGGTIAALNNAALSSTEFAADIAADYAKSGAPAGKIPTPVEIAADASELRSGIPLTTVQAQIQEIGGGPPPQTIQYTTISPQTISGPAPSFVYGLLSNDALIAQAPESVAVIQNAATNGIAIDFINGFNPLTDVIQVQSKEAPNFAAIQSTLQPFGATGTYLQLGSGHQVTLTNVTPQQLTAADFRFV